MRIYRPTFKRNGKTSTSAVWWAQFSVGGKEYRRSLQTRDERIAHQKAATLITGIERQSAGLTDPFEAHRLQGIAKHVTDFEVTLKAKGVTAAHVLRRIKAIRAYVEAAGVRDLNGLDSATASSWLSTLTDAGLGARAVNDRTRSLVHFGGWLVRSRRLPGNPFADLSPLNEAADRRRVRRALSADELSRLVSAAEGRPLAAARAQRIHAGVTAREESRLVAQGRARAVLYAVAAGTGLRRGELRKLRWQDVDTARDLVRVPAATAKAKRDQSVPLRPDLRVALDLVRPADAKPSDLAFPGGAFPTHRTFALDLAAAGIVSPDESGRVVDFHALRGTFISSLAAAGVHPRV
ncbi:MAG: tyrosine-type recombinase/integrase, partial [Planctomycetota bacterium]